MARLRYVKTLEQVKKAQEANPEFLESTARSIRCVYETDPEIAAALVPKPLAEPKQCLPGISRGTQRAHDQINRWQQQSRGHDNGRNPDDCGGPTWLGVQPM